MIATILIVWLGLLQEFAPGFKINCNLLLRETLVNEIISSVLADGYDPRTFSL